MATEQIRDGSTPAVDLSPVDVKRLADLLHLPISAEDLPEVTYRLGALLGELQQLNRPDIWSMEPIPVIFGPDAGLSQPPRASS